MRVSVKASTGTWPQPKGDEGLEDHYALFSAVHPLASTPYLRTAPSATCAGPQSTQLIYTKAAGVFSSR